MRNVILGSNFENVETSFVKMFPILGNTLVSKCALETANHSITK